ncbi:MAG: isoprenylcysteine carboxylmethyltransferase family protein [Ginsengibacter sp.]
MIVSIAFYISMAYYDPLFSNPAFRYVGIAIIILGIILRLIAVASLGKFFTVDVTIRQNHRLKKDGIYKYLRHPSYFASLLSFIGFLIIGFLCF